MAILILTILLILMLELPLIISILYHHDRPGKEMYINQNKKREIAYFAIHAKEEIEDAKINGDLIVYQDGKAAHCVDGDWFDEESTDLLVYSEDDIVIPKIMKSIHNTVYSEGSIKNHASHVDVDALYAKHNITINAPMTVNKWVLSEEVLTINYESTFKSRASSYERIQVNAPLHFIRLFSKKICIGNIVDDGLELPHDLKKEDFITKDHFELDEKFILNGSMKGHKDIILPKGSIVNGNIFAEGKIILNEGCRVNGIVFSQDRIEIHKGCIIGEENETISVIARNGITIEDQCIIYGFIECDKGSKIVI